MDQKPRNATTFGGGLGKLLSQIKNQESDESFVMESNIIATSNRLDSRNDQSKMKLGLNKAVGFTVARNETSMETFPEKTDRQADVTITDRS